MRPAEGACRPDDGAQERALARARWPDQADELARLDREARRLQNRRGAIGERQLVDAQHSASGDRSVEETGDVRCRA